MSNDTLAQSVTMSEYILESQRIRKNLPGVLALNGVGFSLQPGEVHALVGENGAGNVLTEAYESDVRPLLSQARVKMGGVTLANVDVISWRGGGHGWC